MDPVTELGYCIHMSNTPQTESEAYPCGRSYVARRSAQYIVGDAVYVGPAYRSCDSYVADGIEGLYYVVRECITFGEYLLSPTRGVGSHPDAVYIQSPRMSGGRS